MATKPPAAAATAAPVAKIKRGGILRDVDKRTTNSLDIHVSDDTKAMFLNLLYDCLLSYKLVDRKAQTFEVGPSLAESYKVIDPTTVEFRLRKGVKFHDGSDFNAAVAKWNLDRAANHPKSALKVGAPSVIKDVQVVDDVTLRVTLKAPSAVFPLLMSIGASTHLGMVSKEAVEKLGDDQFGRQPVGTGAMRFKEYLPDNRLTLEKFPGHWELGEDGQPLPYVDGVVTRWIIDTAVSAIELRSGNVDALPEVEPKDTTTLRSNPDIVIEEMPGQWATLPSFYFNPRPGLPYPFSNNVKLREAAQYATDRKGMADALGFGVATPHYYPHWFPGNVGYDETLPRREFNLDKAKQLVKEAGFPDGVDTETTVINRPPDVKAVEALQAMWARAGIRIKMTMQDRVVWINNAESGKFDTHSHADNARVDVLVEQQSRTGSRSNWPGYSNPSVDKLWGQAAAEYDTKKRADIYGQIQKILYEDAFHVVGYKWASLIALNKRVKNWTIFWSAKYVWLD